VGLDAVRAEVSAMGGALRMTSRRGEGSSFRMVLPLSVSIAPALVVEAGGVVLAIPVYAVERTVDADEALSGSVGGGWRVRWGEEELAVERLADFLGLPPGESTGREGVVVVRPGAEASAWMVERMLREEDLFVRPLQGPWRKLWGLSGTSILGDGRLVYVLDPSVFTGRGPRRRAEAASPE
jgi:two-component system chemotaxis sensor kinase CheA